MIVRFFKSNQPVTLILLPILAIVIWIFAFSSVSNYSNHAMPLFELLTRMTAGHYFLAVTYSAIALVTGAFIVNFLVDKHELLGKSSYLPAMLYIVLMTSSPELCSFHPLLFSNIFIVIALHKILNSYRKDSAFNEAFEAGFYISIASLFYFPSIFFILITWISFIVLRPFVWREWLIALIGLVTPYLFAGVYYYWFDISEYLWYDKIIYPIASRNTHFQPNFAALFTISTISVLVGLSIIQFVLQSGARKHKTKNAFAILSWSTVIGGLSVFASSGFYISASAIILVPFTVFIANYFTYVKPAWWAEFLFFALMVVIIYNHLSAI